MSILIVFRLEIATYDCMQAFDSAHLISGVSVAPLEYVAIAKSAESDSGKTSRLTALLRQEENNSLLECFRGEGQ
jgi:hypothetical protein